MRYPRNFCLSDSTPSRCGPRSLQSLWVPSTILLGLILLAKPSPAQTPDLTKLSSQGQAALRDQHFDRAAEVYEEIIKLDPRSAQAHSNLGLAFYMAAKYPRAITEFQKALELDPHLDHTKVLLALSYFDTGEIVRATPLLEKAYLTNKDDPVVAAHLGLAYLRQEKDEKALAVLSHWVELEPNSPDALYFKGKAAMYLASDSFVQLTKAAPDSYRMYQLRAEMLRQQGQGPAAINEYKKAISEKPDAAGLHYALGTLYREAGRLDEALTEFDAELKISPNDAMTEFFLGDIYLQQDNVENAQQYLARALAIQPALADAQIDMAKTYHRQGKIAEAVNVLQTVVASDPNQQDAHYLLFSLYKEEGQTEQARKELATFEELKRKAQDQDQKRMRVDSLN
jgi:tetratricopeptide (TPR) repeat protein